MSSIAAARSAAIANTPLLKAGNWCGRIPGLPRAAEAEALWRLKDRNFSQVTRELGISYGTLRRLLEREIDEEALGFIREEDEIYLGIDEHSFRHQELHIITEVKQKKVNPFHVIADSNKRMDEARRIE